MSSVGTIGNIVTTAVTCASGSTNITGKVTRLDGTTPLKGVLVAAKAIVGGKTYSYMVYSALDGTFTISNPTIGTYTLNALLSGYTFAPVTGVAVGSTGNLIKANK